MRWSVRGGTGVLLLQLVGLAPPTACPAQAPAARLPPYETFTLESRATAEPRTVNIYTPPGYAAGTERFPVLYMPDGGVEEDFPHVAGTIDSLIALGLIRPVLVVGVENTVRRRDMTGPTVVGSDSAIAPRVGGSAAFRSFFREELMPEVRRRFRVTDEAGIVGESLAGLFVVETFLLEPALFRHYIALSPSLWWNGGALVQGSGPRVAALGPAPSTFYLASADEAIIVPVAAALADTLRQRAPAALTWFFEPRPDLTHGTIYRALAPGAFARVLR